MSVVSRTSVTISCTATGKPSPTISWLFKGQSLRDSASPNSYIIDVNSIQKAGVYTCKASNKHLLVEKFLEIQVQGMII